MAYHYSRKLNLPFDEVVNRLDENLQHQGFAVITCIDVQQILKQKFNIDFRHYKVLGAFHPEIAYKSISLESHSGLLFPCHLVIQQHENREVEVSAISPMEAMELAGQSGTLTDLARDTDNRLRAAVDGLRSSAPAEMHEEALPPTVHGDNPSFPG